MSDRALRKAFGVKMSGYPTGQTIMRYARAKALADNPGADLMTETSAAFGVTAWALQEALMATFEDRELLRMRILTWVQANPEPAKGGAK